MKRLRLADLITAGPRAVSRYTGTLLSVFVLQSALAAACMLAVAGVLAQVFAHRPLFDDAVDADLVALIGVLRWGRATMLACLGIVFATVLLWQLVSWFVVGGILGVLGRAPEGRGDTARCFGASGVTTYLAYLRLWLCSLPGWLVVLFVFGITMNAIAPRLELALTIRDLVAPLAIVAVPTLVLVHVLTTVTDYARVELSLRRESHDPGVIATYLRTFAFVLRRPVTLVHGGLGWLAFIAVGVGYALLANNRAMYGAEGAITLYVIRQGVNLLRMALRFGVLAGQLELGRTRTPPPRRVEAKVDIIA